MPLLQARWLTASGRHGRVGRSCPQRVPIMGVDDAPLSSEALYQSLVESLPLSVFQKDLDCRLLFGNRRFCEALGRTPEELRGRTDFDLFPRELAEKYRRDDLHVIATGELLEDIEQIAGAEGRRS